MTLVFNVLFAWLISKERPTRWDLLATVLIGGGSALVAIFGYAPEGRTLARRRLAFADAPPAAQ